MVSGHCIFTIDYRWGVGVFTPQPHSKRVEYLMAEVFQFGIVICGINTALLLFAIFTFKIGKRIHHSGEAITRTGIAPAGSGFYGSLESDIKTHPAAGCFFTLMSYCWYIIGVIILITLAVLDIIVIFEIVSSSSIF